MRTTFADDDDDDIRRQESDELHGHAGGWFDQYRNVTVAERDQASRGWYTFNESELLAAARAPKIPNTHNGGTLVMRNSTATLKPVEGTPYAPEVRAAISAMIADNAPLVLLNFQTKPDFHSGTWIYADKLPGGLVSRFVPAPKVAS